MNWKTALFAATALAVLAAAPGTAIVGIAHATGCEAGDKIDGSTVVAARKQMENAGFHRVYGLKKSCDNFWHAMATKDGSESRVALSPHGDVMREGD